MQTPATHRSLWPLAIISYFAVVIFLITMFIVWAVRQDVDLVRKNYYADEIKFQAHLDKVQRTQALTSSASIFHDPKSGTVKVALPSNHTLSPAKGWIELYRPSAARLDQRIELAPDAAGRQEIDVSDLASGLWRVRLNWTSEGEDFFTEETLVIGSP
jgi:nitrogen fixation protein FixH